jgi:hypothetical protein
MVDALTAPGPGRPDEATGERQPSGAAPVPPQWPPWAPWALVGVLVAVRVAAIVVMLTHGVADEHSILGGDARRYAEYFSTPGTAYRDFPVEYPPLALGLAALVHQPSLLASIALLAASQLLLELLVAGVLASTWGRRTAVVYLVLGTPMAFFPFPYVRIDLLVVFLAVAGAALARRRHATAGGVVLAAAVFAKVWPVVLAPAMVVRRQWRGVLAWVTTGAIGLAAWVTWAGTAGIDQVGTFRGAKGWQIESLPGIVIHMRDPAASHVEQGAWRTSVEVDGWEKLAMAVAMAAVVALAWWWAARCSGRARDLAVDAYAPVAAVIAMLVFAPILSPQYILWFVPFAAIAAGRGDRVVGWLTLAITALTTFILASIHAQTEGARWATWPIVVRNGLLVALGVVALARLRAGRRRPAPGAEAVEAAPPATASPSA